jgi:tetratricopeptide (TPR) repeat protein
MQVSADHLLGQARERFAVQDYYGAVHLLEELIESGRSFADAHHLLGLSLALLGHKPRALEQFERALAEAVVEYRRAVELGPAFHDLRYRLARLLLEAGRPLEAREELERILAAHPDFVDAQASLGLAHYLAGDAAAARDIWARCQARRPNNARVEAYQAMARRLPA